MDIYRNSSLSYKKFLVILLVVLILIIFSGATYYFITKSHNTISAKTQPTASITSSLSLIKIPNPTQQYYSDNLSLGFNYPNNWVVVDATGSNQISVTSPTLKLANASNQIIYGKIIMAIYASSPTTLNGFANGTPTAAIASQLINYSNPTQTQKASTYLSFLQYGGSNTTTNTINAIYITGNSGYKVNQNIPESDILAVNPTVDISFIGCSNSTCSGATQTIAIPITLWQSSLFSNPLLSMLESLSIN